MRGGCGRVVCKGKCGMWQSHGNLWSLGMKVRQAGQRWGGGGRGPGVRGEGGGRSVRGGDTIWALEQKGTDGVWGAWGRMGARQSTAERQRRWGPAAVGNNMHRQNLLQFMAVFGKGRKAGWRGEGNRQVSCWRRATQTMQTIVTGDCKGRKRGGSGKEGTRTGSDRAQGPSARTKGDGHNGLQRGPGNDGVWGRASNEVQPRQGERRAGKDDAERGGTVGGLFMVDLQSCLPCMLGAPGCGPGGRPHCRASCVCSAAQRVCLARAGWCLGLVHAS